MKNNKLHTPKGVKDFLPSDCINKLEIEKNIEHIFNIHGYCNIETPTFEFYEVFSDEVGGIYPEQMYKFFDRDGSILALRADMTPPIARVVATSYKKEDLPLRFCYVGKAFRYNENYQGKLREFSQAGVELIGVNSDEADAEIISIAVKSILAIGFTDNFRLDIGHVDFFNGLLEEAGFDKNTSIEVQNMISQKDYIGLEEILEETTIKPNIKKLFLDLPKFVGSIEVLQNAKNLITNIKALKALKKLENLYNICKDYNIEKYISFDLGMITHLNYYTGIIFRGYTYGTGFSIIDGGRYDNLIKEFGMNAEAVGFGIRINEILNVLEHQGDIKFNLYQKTALLVYNNSNRKIAFLVADELRKREIYIQNSLISNDIVKNLEFAKLKDIDMIIYIENNNEIQLIDVQTNKTETLDTNSILGDYKFGED